jgi:hypothetical protein
MKWSALRTPSSAASSSRARVDPPVERDIWVTLTIAFIAWVIFWHFNAAGVRRTEYDRRGIANVKETSR